MIKYWILAARPKTLFVSVAPVLLGCAFAYQQGVFQWIPALLCLLFALLAQITSNLINDYFDFVKGSDRSDRLGPDRMCALGLISPKAMLRASILTISMALVLGLFLLFWGGWELILVGLFVAIFAFAYSGGPYPLSYHGWGDVAVLIFYGIVPVYFTYYVQDPTFQLEVLLGSIAVGLMGVNLLIVNNYRDYEADKASGKRTTVVRFGRPFMAKVYVFNILAAYILGDAVTLFSSWFWWLSALFLIPFSFYLNKQLVALPAAQLNSILGKTALNVFIYALLLSIALLL